MSPHSFVFSHTIVLKACLYELKCLWQILFITRKYSHALLMYKISLPVILSGLMWCLLEFGLHLFFCTVGRSRCILCHTVSVWSVYPVLFCRPNGKASTSRAADLGSVPAFTVGRSRCILCHTISVWAAYPVPACWLSGRAFALRGTNLGSISACTVGRSRSILCHTVSVWAVYPVPPCWPSGKASASRNEEGIKKFF